MTKVTTLGLCSFNMQMPEEINRILTDQISSILFCPTKAAVINLESEGFRSKPVQVIQVGDVMQDSAEFFAQRATPPHDFNVGEGFILTTLHRAENTDDPQRLAAIIEALNLVHDRIAPVVLPLHPRTRNVVANLGLKLDVNVIDPAGYLEMIWLLQHSGLVLTDSGGYRKRLISLVKLV